MMRHLPLNLRLALLYAALFAVIGVSLPFLPLWLQTQGVSAAEIGVIIGVPVLVRVVAAPLVTEIADRLGRPVATMRVAALLTLGSYGLLALAQGFWALLAAACLAAAASAAVIPLCDSLAVASLGARYRSFGPVRLWGSVAFVVGSALAGVAVDVYGGGGVLGLLVLLQGVGVAASLVCIDDARREEKARALPPPSRLLFTAPLLLPIGAAALIQASHAAYYALGTVHWRMLGFEGPVIALLWSVGVVAEILLFLGSTWLPAPVQPRHLMAAGAAAAILRWGAMACDPSLGPLLALQALHAFSFAATYLGMMRAITAAGRAGLAARIQGLSAMMQGLAMAAAMSVAGSVHAGGGGAMYGLMAILAVLGGGVVVLAWRKIPQPHNSLDGGKTVEPL